MGRSLIDDDDVDTQQRLLSLWHAERPTLSEVAFGPNYVWIKSDQGWARKDTQDWALSQNVDKGQYITVPFIAVVIIADAFANDQARVLVCNIQGCTHRRKKRCTSRRHLQLINDV